MNIIGLLLSSLKKKSPLGPSILRMVFSFSVLKMKFVNLPSSTKRICSSIMFELVGELAIENDLGSKSECSKSRYWPARYCIDWEPGIFSNI